MNILILGSGGREHALAWKIRQSPLCEQLYIAPGNAGTALVGVNKTISINDFEGLSSFCLTNAVGMLIVGPEEPLVKGIYDHFKDNPLTKNILVIGPSKAAAQLEGSKAFAKQFMERNQIPTAGYKEFDADCYTEGINYIKAHTLPIVLKADGLAAGKGVIICANHIEALAEFELMIQRSKFGAAGKKVVIEAFLKGIEMSVFALTDGSNYVLLPDAKDYKRIGKGDTGPNTGGMGAVSPVPFADQSFQQKIKERITEPTIRGIRQEGLTYVGIVFIGIIKVGDDPFVIEYNCRMGDPETEVIIPRIESDLVAIFIAAATGRLSDVEVTTSSKSAVTIVAVSGGYPNAYETGKEIRGLNEKVIDDTIVFHSGTKQEEGRVVTNGGRVLAVTSFGENIKEASEHAIYQLEHLFFDDIYYRDDIGYEFA